MPENKSTEQPTQTDQIAQLRSVYINGFGIGLGNCDVTLMLQANGRPLFLMNMSYTVAKTLAQELTKTIEQLEKASGRQIMTAHETASFLRKSVTHETE